MNIIKSLHAGILHKTFSFKGKHYFAVSLLWGFKLDSGEPVLEQKIWTSIGAMMGKNELFDAAMPKANAEMLVHGSFFASGGKLVQGGTVSVSCGPIRKKLLVFGDRHWIKKIGVAVGITDPVPMSEMPISYAHAFGGEGFEKNPVGKGFSATKSDDETVHTLPNVEYPDQLIGSPSDRPAPASFGRLDIMWPQRLSKAGTYDQKYIRERMPGLPDDINWEYFNDAAPDQWLDGFFHGTEHYEISNMNPAKPYLEGKLPGLYGRCFVNQETPGQISFREIQTKLDTVWFFPAENLGVMIHRGSLEVTEDDGCDIKQIVLSHENLVDPPRTPDFYLDQMKKRLDPDEGFKYLLLTKPFIPDGCRCGFEMIQEDTNFPLENLGRQNLETFVEEKRLEAEETLEKQKKDISESLAQSPSGKSEIDIDSIFASMDKPATTEDSPDVKELKAIIEKIAPGVLADPKHLDISGINMKGFDDLRAFTDRLTAEKKAETENRIRDEIAKLQPMMNQQGIPEAAARLEQSLLEMNLPPMLPRFNFDETLASLRKTYDESMQQMLIMHSMGVSPKELPTVDLNFEEYEKKIKENLQKAVEGYRMGAHFIPAARSPHPGKEAEIAARFLKTFKQGGQTAFGDYAFTDLSNQDLTGIDLSNAFLEYTNLSGSNLTGANLSNAILAHANLSDANLSNANLKGANLGAALMVGTRCADADLSGACLGKAILKGASFLRCRIVDRQDMFLETVFEQTDFSGSMMRRNNFLDAVITGCTFTEADLSESNFVKPTITDSVFDRAILTSVNFVTAKTARVSFRKASMKNVRFVAGCSLVDAILIGAEACEANFRECNLKRADFSTAHLDKADFGSSDLTESRFAGAIARQAQFNKANLNNAVLFRANLMEASLHKANLAGVRFSGANLYSVNFMGCKLGETDFTNANLEKTLLKNWEG